MTDPVAHYAVLHQCLSDINETGGDPFAKRIRELRSTLSHAAAAAMAQGLDERAAKAEAIQALRAQVSEHLKITDTDIDLHRTQRYAAQAVREVVLGA